VLGVPDGSNDDTLTKGAEALANVTVELPGVWPAGDTS
jgi:hypothetical protein